MKRVLAIIFWAALLTFNFTGLAGATLDWGVPVPDLYTTGDNEGEPIPCGTTGKNQMKVVGTFDEQHTFNTKGDTHEWVFDLPLGPVKRGFTFVGSNVLGIDLSGIANEDKAFAEILFDGLSWVGTDGVTGESLDTSNLKLSNTPAEESIDYAYSFLLTNPDPIADNYKLLVEITSNADEPFTIDSLDLELHYCESDLTWSEPIVDKDATGASTPCDVEGNQMYVEYYLKTPKTFDTQGQTETFQFYLTKDPITEVSINGPIVVKDTFSDQQEPKLVILFSGITDVGEDFAEILIDGIEVTGTRSPDAQNQTVAYEVILTDGSLEDDYSLDITITSLDSEPFTVDEMDLELHYCKYVDINFRSSSSSSCFIKTLFE